MRLATTRLPAGDPEWFADEPFWQAVYPFLFTADRMGEAGEEIDGLLALVPAGGRAVLDLCCGPGRHAVALARRGFAVTGVDRSPFLLDRARRLAARQQVTAEWVEADMREFVRPKSFDLAISMFSSLGYFEDPQQDLQVLRNLHDSLRPGAALVVEAASKEVLAASFEPVLCDDGPDGSLLVRRHEIVDDWTRVRNEWHVIGNAGARTWRFDLRVFSGQELRNLMLEAGFSQVLLYGDLDGCAYGAEGSRLVAVGVRQPT